MFSCLFFSPSGFKLTHLSGPDGGLHSFTSFTWGSSNTSAQWFKCKCCSFVNQSSGCWQQPQVPSVFGGLSSKICLQLNLKPRSFLFTAFNQTFQRRPHLRQMKTQKAEGEQCLVTILLVTHPLVIPSAFIPSDQWSRLADTGAVLANHLLSPPGDQLFPPFKHFPSWLKRDGSLFYSTHHLHSFFYVSSLFCWAERWFCTFAFLFVVCFSVGYCSPVWRSRTLHFSGCLHKPVNPLSLQLRRLPWD